MVALLAWVAAGLSALGAASVLVLTARRVHVARSERRRAELEERVRPVALALVDGEEPHSLPLDADAVEALATVLGRYSRWLRGDAGAHLAGFFERRGLVEREAVLLRHRRFWRRATAAAALGEMRSLRAVPALLIALEDPQREVRMAAAGALGRLQAAEAVEALVDRVADDRLPWAVAGQALLSIGAEALPGLRRLEESPIAEARAFATELVGLLGDAADAPALVVRLRDSSAEVRAKAARALGRLGAEEGAAGLRRALDDRIPFVRATAAIALGAIGDREALPALLAQARSDRFEAARAAARAVASIDPSVARRAAEEEDGGIHLQEVSDLLAIA